MERKSRKLTEEHKEKIRMACLGRSSVKYWLGKKRPEISKNMRGEKNHQWKEEGASYSVIHRTLKNQFGKAAKCENPKCVYPRKNADGKIMSKPKTYHWANISGHYRRDRTDYIQLCPSCHKKFDLGSIKIAVLVA